MSAPNDAIATNHAIISYTAVTKETKDGKPYVRIPNVDKVEVSFTDPNSFEAQGVRKARQMKNNTAGDLIQLYSTDVFPVDTRNLQKVRHSVWDIKELPKGLANVQITCDLSAHRK